MRRRTAISGGVAFAALTGHMDKATATLPDGFYVPAEEEPHDRTFMQWPVNHHVYPDPVFLNMVQQTIADIANAIVAFEPVTLLMAKDDIQTARAKLSDTIEIWDIPTDDLWCRDSGPLFAINPNGERAVCHIQFNSWGDKQGHARDAKVAEAVAQRLSLRIFASGLYGEPGGVEHDGHGLLMAHESSWVNDNRNPGFSRQEIEAKLLEAYGATRMIWSDGVWGEDITDYHIDSLARFTGPRRVLINLPDAPESDDPFHIAALDTHDTLIAAGLDVDVIPEPHQRRVSSIDFVASYANYYVCNGAVIAAQFGDEETDAIAAETLAKHFPNRRIVQLNVDPLGELGGGIHCATQQMPAV